MKCNTVRYDMSAVTIHTTPFLAHWKFRDCCVCLKFMEMIGISWSMKEALLSGIRKSVQAKALPDQYHSYHYLLIPYNAKFEFSGEISDACIFSTLKYA